MLLASIAGGDEAAFSRMLRIYGDTVFSQALAYTKSVQTAEEVSQDVFLHVWNKRDKLLEVEHFEAWFFQVTRRQILNYMKKKVSQPLSALLPDLRGVMEMEEQLVPDRQMEARDTYQLLLKGIEQLPEKRGAPADAPGYGRSIYYEGKGFFTDLARKAWNRYNRTDRRTAWVAVANGNVSTKLNFFEVFVNRLLSRIYLPLSY